MEETLIIDNPAWTEEMLAKARRGELTAACHDGSDHLGVICAGGHQNHLHRTQVERLPKGAEIMMRCQSCSRVIEMERDTVLAALDEAWGRNQ